MRISDSCIACGICPPYCPVQAIKAGDSNYSIDEDQCVECGVCRRNAGCPTDAFFMPPESNVWPRSLRAEFSDPMRPHPTTQGLGRGTEEMKCNDVTARFGRGEAGVAMEFGRPGIATRLREVEKMTKALAAVGVIFEKKNPVYDLLADPATGAFKPEVMNERVLSAIVEVKAPADRLPEMLAVAKRVAGEIDTVFSLDVISRVNDDGTIPVLATIEQAGFQARPNAKVNLGLGKPLIP
ncbi:MAG: hypothetical protein Q8O07_00505 [Chloroflexota bacterium]|nr:hypothetical protein [Chloroflexota bacterium]